jgi:hypothetical protein
MKDVKVLQALKELGTGIKSTDRERCKRRRRMKGNGEGEMMDLKYRRSLVPPRYLRW